jgi:hypothetical protein
LVGELKLKRIFALPIREKSSKKYRLSQKNIFKFFQEKIWKIGFKVFIFAAA